MTRYYYPPEPAPRSRIHKRTLSRLLGALRRGAELLTGRSWLWSWLWRREFDSLVRDQNAQRRSAGKETDRG
jgi:hypothetical protein